MRLLIIVLFIVTSVLADEMQRIEAIVEDISTLRNSYEECQKELSLKPKTLEVLSCEKEDKKIEDLQILLQDESEKNTILLKEIGEYKKSSLNIQDLKNQIIDYKKLLQIKENENISLKNKITKNKCKPKIIVKKSENTNLFPKLIMKDEYKKVVLKKEVTKEITKEIIKEFKASAFRLKEQSDIYDSFNGKVVQNWEKETSFTSNIGTQNWVKITGYFIDKTWLKAKKDLWIQKDKVLQR